MPTPMLTLPAEDAFEVLSRLPGDTLAIACDVIDSFEALEMAWEMAILYPHDLAIGVDPDSTF